MTNTSGTSPAAVPEGAIRAGEIHEATPHQDWSWVEPRVWTERMLAALEQGVKGGQWYSLIDKLHPEDVLGQAFAQVAANRGAAGVDHVTIAHYATDLDANPGLRRGRF
jgi:RNA-directed DNA polymerase